MRVYPSRVHTPAAAAATAGDHQRHPVREQEQSNLDREYQRRAAGGGVQRRAGSVRRAGVWSRSCSCGRARRNGGGMGGSCEKISQG
jgi:hypothetical protein